MSLFYVNFCWKQSSKDANSCDMDDAMCTAGSSSSTCDTTTAPCPVQQNQVPIWRRHVFPASPAVNVDPFELPSNLTPALKRVKSRTKLPAKGSAATSSLSRLPSSSECGSSSTVPPFPVRSSPRKKPPSPIPSKTDQYLSTRIEGKFDSESARGDTQATVSDAADRKPSSQTPSRVRDPFYPISLPPKKPRLAFMPVSTSDLRPPRKPIMVEPDYQQVPSSSMALSRLPKALRHSSVNLRTAVEKDSQEQKSSQNDVAQLPTERAGSSRMFQSRSTMNLRLTPERDMRERRRSGAENTAMVTPRASPKKRLQSSATVSDLRQTMMTPTRPPTRRGRRISLSENVSKELPPKPLRKRSSSLEVRASKTGKTALCSKKELNEDKPQEDQGSSHSAMQNSTNPGAEISVETAADIARKDLAESIKSVTLESTPNQSSEELSAIPAAADEMTTKTDVPEESTALQQPSTTQVASGGSPDECLTSSSQIPQQLSAGDASTDDTCPAQSASAALKDRNSNVTEEKPPSAEVVMTSGSSGELKQENDSTEQQKSSPEKVAAASNEREIVVEVEQSCAESKADEAVAQEIVTVATSDAQSNVACGADSELTSEQSASGMGLNATCYCSQEASSSTSACQAEKASEGGQGSSASQPSLSIVLSIEYEEGFLSSAPCMTRNSSLKSVKSEPSLDKRVRFQNVNVFYFARTQGMSTVPKSGEVSLGMVDKHFTKRQFPLWFGRRPELTLPNDYEEELSEGEDPGDVFDPEGLERCTAHQLPMFEGKARIKMLKRSGVQVQKDGNVESLESIRRSRILCGCQCERGLCKPDTCQCSLDGIGCQVDGPDEFGKSHPCSCTAATCLNPCGRIEFDPDHVKNHFRITMMRLKHAEQKAKFSILQIWHILTLLARLIANVQVLSTKTSKFVVFRTLKVKMWTSCPAKGKNMAMRLLEVLHCGKPTRLLPVSITICTCQIQEYVFNKLTHVRESAIPNITEWRGTRLSDKGACLDHLTQDLICPHEIVEGAERALEMDLGTESKANISLISGTFSLKLWQMPMESSRFHNVMSTRAR
ncbi:hypothetical protein Y032_0180g817 [Ancylostoma ceylanicum]|uniref:Cysteine/serine-rich nuclear protein N-terminal domain-containing protein n=1 Tax=Ancylostoma ceylanicum TaxID=53326 RepID=A0A016SSZ6_9BILA|nr:hypothetical protein Y032_0180g817 [Ancylostoma ceylanicum]